MSEYASENQSSPLISTDFEIYLTGLPSVACAGDTIKVSLWSDPPLVNRSNLVLALVSEDDEDGPMMEIEASDSEIEFVVPETFPIGEYSLLLRQGEWILDSIPFEIADAEYARQATAFTTGLSLRVNAMKAIEQQDYDLAAHLTQQVEALYTEAGSTHIGAKAWKELGAAYLGTRQYYRAREALSRAFSLYGTVNDAEGQAGTLLLLGEVSSKVSQIKEALEYLDRARTLADSCHADTIALRSRAELWRLSSGSDEAVRRRYVRDLVVISCSLKSSTSRNEALSLYRELVPGSLLNNLWAFDQSYISAQNLKFECSVSSRFMASHHGRLISAGNWGEGMSTPWESLLAVFTSTLLTQIILSLSRFVVRMNRNDFEFKVTTHRDMNRECFLLSIAPSQEHEGVRETINRYVSSDADFHYYGQLARMIGASLVGRTDQLTFIEMEMPLTLGEQNSLGIP